MTDTEKWEQKIDNGRLFIVKPTRNGEVTIARVLASAPEAHGIARLFIAAPALRDAGGDVLSFLTDDHEDCHICLRDEGEIEDDGHDPESACGALEAALAAAEGGKVVHA